MPLLNWRSPLSQPGASKALVLVALLVLSVVVALAQLTPPAPLPANAPATEFSAQRAMTHLEAIARQPRPVGSAGHAAAQAYLVSELEALGLQPEIQATTVVNRWPGATQFEVASVENVLARLPGAASSGAIALDGHYDSATTAPGAADCGACVATLLETLRALQAGPPLQNDVIFVFADAEENGDLGAHAFVTQHPWSKDVRLAINFEATGNRGPSILYSVSPHNQRLIDGFAKASPYPVAYSFASAFLHWLPMLRGGCDLEEFMDRGVPGLGFALAGNTTGYHTNQDNVDTLSRRSLQHQGSQALALLQYFGNRDLTELPSADDAVYFNILPGVVVHYSTSWALPLAGLVGLLYLGIVWLGRRRQQLTLQGIMLGAIAFVVSGLTALALTAVCWWGIKTLNDNLQVLMVGHYRAPLYFVGLALFTVGLMVVAQIGLRQRLSLNNLMAGTWLVWASLMLTTSTRAPDVSYLFTFPLLFTLLLLSRQVLEPKFQFGSWGHILVLALAALPGMLLLLPAMVYPNLAWMLRFELVIPFPFLALAAIFVVLLMGLLAPHVELLTAGPTSRRIWRGRPQQRWQLPGLLLLAIALVLGAATATSGFDAAHPRPNSITYEVNADSGTAVWASADAQLDSWTSQFFPASPNQQRHEFPSGFQLNAFVAPAPVASLAAPEAVLVKSSIDGNRRRLNLRLRSPRQAPTLQATIVADAPITEATINGQPFNWKPQPAERRDRLTLAYHNFPDEGADLTITIESTQPVQLTLKDVSYGLPQTLSQTIVPRSADQMPSVVDFDPTAVSKSFQL